MFSCICSYGVLWYFIYLWFGHLCFIMSLWCCILHFMIVILDVYIIRDLHSLWSINAFSASMTARLPVHPMFSMNLCWLHIDKILSYWIVCSMLLFIFNLVNWMDDTIVWTILTIHAFAFEYVSFIRVW